MRSLIRIVAPVLAAVTIALAGSSSALAASKAPKTWSPPPVSAPVRGPVTGAPPPVSAPVRGPATWSPPPVSAPLSAPATGWVVDDEWCNGDDAFTTCFDFSGHVQLVSTGRTSAVVVNMNQYAAHYVDGVLVAEDTEVSHERFADSGGGTYTVHVVTHTRVNDGDVTCSYQEVFRIVDFELVTDHEGGTCG